MRSIFKQVLRIELIILGVIMAIGISKNVFGSDIMDTRWDGEWIRTPNVSEGAYSVQYFRKSFELADEPEKFVVHVSADSRYKLYVNGSLASFGPAAGDYYQWNFESVDIAEWLGVGENVVAAIVWNEGEYRQESQISYKTGFVLQGGSEAGAILNTGSTWRSMASEAYSPIPGIGYSTYYVCGPGERFDANKAPVGWQFVGFDDSGWQRPERIGWPGKGSPKGLRDAAGWMLVERIIPPLELTPQRFTAVRRSSIPAAVANIQDSSWSLEIPANSEEVFLLDQGVLTNAYPKIQFSGGYNAEISLQYNESLFENMTEYGPHAKGHRDEVKGKTMRGRRDVIVSNGAEGQTHETLSWRTFRYVEVTITTGEEPLRLDDVSSSFVGYPFEMNARLKTDNPELTEMLEIGWRTARLCAVETYMDCPYYEQLQYIGDARIQALVSLYNSGDDRLLRNALNLMDQSRIAEGITMSRHPSVTPQIISTFSLWYIGMLHDYWWYGSDAEFVAEKLGGVRQVLSFFERFQAKDGSLRDVPYWVFTDWVDNEAGWDYGEAPRGDEGESALLDLQLLWAYQLASELEATLGMQAFANRYAEKAEQLEETIRSKYWNAESRLFSDTSTGTLYFSQHANALAILTGVIEGTEATDLARRIVDNSEMAPASIYFRYYLHQALAKAGLGDDYLSWLSVWRDHMASGLTTWAEKTDANTTRSDCHAWGSSPNVEFFRIVLGIDSDAAGFARVRVTPHLGDLKNASGAMPHPMGEVVVAYSIDGDVLRATIDLPLNVEGTFVWKGVERELVGGTNQFEL